MKVHSKYLKSAVSPAHFPVPGCPEIAFAGRSNVGKSSLINSLLGDKIAKTSSTPGRTRAINFFEVRMHGDSRPECMFVDLPGYGYAKLPVEVTAQWPGFIEPYLEKREPLALCVVLVDINIPPQTSDRQLLEWLRRYQRPFLIVATKADKLSGNKLAVALKAFRSDFPEENILTFSVRTGAGRAELWHAIRDAVNAKQSEAKRADRGIA